MYCVCGITALEVYRAMGQRLPEILDRPRTSRLAGCSIPPRVHLSDDMARLGAGAGPYHLLLLDKRSCHRRPDIVCHTAPRIAATPRSLIRLEGGPLIVSPEQLLLDLAAQRSYDDIDLLLIAFELCGTYVLDASWDGFTNVDRAATSRARLMRYAERARGRRGAARAGRIASLVIDGSHSPMETVMAMLFCLPHRLGGMGFQNGRLNERIKTADGTRWVDLAFPEGYGLEYQGRSYHSVERTGRDAQRQHHLIGAGMTTINVWYQDLAELHHFERLASDLAAAPGVRIRVRARNFTQRRAVLRARVLPSLNVSCLPDQ